jgi:hypothetical protein
VDNYLFREGKIVAKKKKRAKSSKKSARPSSRKTTRRSTRKKIAKRKVVRRSDRRTGTPRRKISRRKSAPRRVAKSLAIPRTLSFNHTGLSSLNYHSIESEIYRLTELLQTIRKKNKLVRKSLAYLEREQKKVARQIRDARRFLTQLKNRGIKVLREFPVNAEEMFAQLKTEISRISRRLGIS